MLSSQKASTADKRLSMLLIFLQKLSLNKRNSENLSKTLYICEESILPYSQVWVFTDVFLAYFEHAFSYT